MERGDIAGRERVERLDVDEMSGGREPDSLASSSGFDWPILDRDNGERHRGGSSLHCDHRDQTSTGTLGRLYLGETRWNRCFARSSRGSRLALAPWHRAAARFPRSIG